MIKVFYSLLVIFLVMLYHVSSTIYANPPKYSNLTRLKYRDMEAEFGSMPVDGISGVLDSIKPLNACHTLIPVSKKGIFNPIVFALIKESVGCSYSEQVIHAQEAGYKAAIVYSSKDDGELVTMGGDGPIIVAVYIKKSAGVDLMNYLYSSGAEIKIVPNPQIPLQLYLVPFAIVVGVCFFFMLTFTIGRYVRYWLRLRRSRLSPANLKKIPTRKFKKGDEFDVCAICIEEYVQNDKIRILPCSHAYHCKCVDPWLTSGKKLCPVCKQSVEATSKRTRNNTLVGINASSVPIEDGETAEDENTPLLAASQNIPNSGAMA